MLKLKLQYFGHLMRRVDSLEKTLMLGGTGGRRRRGRQRMRWLDGISNLMDVRLSASGSWWWTGRPGVLPFMGSQGVGHDWATELNWTESELLHPPQKKSIHYFHESWQTHYLLISLPLFILRHCLPFKSSSNGFYLNGGFLDYFIFNDATKQ